MPETPYTHGALDSPHREAAGARRAPEQCFDAERYGSPYFTMTVRADIGDGRESLQRAFRWEIQRYQGQFGKSFESTPAHRDGTLIDMFRKGVR